jgi:general secretion pathway protein I
VRAGEMTTQSQGAVRRGGFTLVEVLAALVIVSLGMLGVIEAVSQTANSGAYLRDKTFAHWIGRNRVTEVRLENQPPKVTESSDEVEMAGRKWRWSMEVTQTDVESIRRIDVSVALADAPKDSSLVTVTGFYGAAVEQPGSTASLWPGGDAGGGADGGQPGGDPNAPKDPNSPPPQDPNTPGAPPADPNPVPPPIPPTDPGEPAPSTDPGSF